MISENPGGNRNFQRFCAARHGDVNAPVALCEQLRADAVRFVAQNDAPARQIDAVQRNAVRRKRRAEQGQTVRAHRCNSVCPRGERYGRDAEARAHRGADDFGRIRIDACTGEPDGVKRKRVGNPQDGSGVAGVGDAVQQEQALNGTARLCSRDPNGENDRLRRNDRRAV